MYDNPDMMVIGDSLAQGCRSLSVTSLFCSQSWPARVAAAKGWNYVPPNHPQPVLFDLEMEIRKLNPVAMAADSIRLDGFVGRFLDNLDKWERRIPDSVECFDNLALAGALVADLYKRTAKSSDDTIKDIVNGNRLNALTSGKISDLHISVNGRYVLNPSKNAEYDRLTPLDWVEKRKPKNLFVQVGHNHGLFEVGFSASISNINNPEASITQPGCEGCGDYWTQWEVVAKRLAELPADVEQIVIVLLPKVGAVGNLMPSNDDRNPNNYAPAYEPKFSTHPRLQGSQLEGVDNAIISVNRKINGIILAEAAKTNTTNRIKFVDAFATLKEYDYKNTNDTKQRIIISEDVTVDNRYLNGRLRFGWPNIEELSRGGFFSVDGMHPSGVGYAVIASKVLEVIGVPNSYNHDDSLQKAYAEDRLLSDYPVELDMLVDLLAILREAISVGHFDHSPIGSISDDFHFADLLRVLKGIFIH